MRHYKLLVCLLPKHTGFQGPEPDLLLVHGPVRCLLGFPAWRMLYTDIINGCQLGYKSLGQDSCQILMKKTCHHSEVSGLFDILGGVTVTMYFCWHMRWTGVAGDKKGVGHKGVICCFVLAILSYALIFQPSGVSSTPSSSGMVTMVSMGNYGYEFVPMEKSFRLTARGSSGHVDGAINHNLGYFGMDQYQYSLAYSFFDKVRPIDETMEEDRVEDHGSPEIETLPLFPVHCEDIPLWKLIVESDCSDAFVLIQKERIFHNKMLVAVRSWQNKDWTIRFAHIYREGN
ncbi:hypothetical protein RIF29_24221 [Crotalaria pallida]|uniref:RNase H type-1 domain-containing protein n=1 Tax=Crotalaria pallida TaxID=3830 RepID=A0AAN9HZY7_CROPI